MLGQIELINILPFIFLQVPSPCDDPNHPLKCSIFTTVHNILLQEGDTLEIILQAPPDYIPPTNIKEQVTTQSIVTESTTQEHTSSQSHSETSSNNQNSWKDTTVLKSTTSINSFVS